MDIQGAVKYTSEDILKKYDNKTLEKKILILEGVIDYVVARGQYTKAELIARMMGYDSVELEGYEDGIFIYFGA